MKVYSNGIVFCIFFCSLQIYLVSFFIPLLGIYGKLGTSVNHTVHNSSMARENEPIMPRELVDRLVSSKQLASRLIIGEATA
jgi:hypothetical protein